ncbi:MAG: preprotein translocase subunit SecE [Candidatus Nanopelagicales bacterium]|nr:preprotein translocase subunit SecE [Candidatus Nanopelagicales bacterium]
MSDVAEPTDLVGGNGDDDAEGAQQAGRGGDRKKPNVFSRLALFFRQVVAELRKVIWPTRRDLVSYTAVVVVFCVIMAGFIALCDFLFGKAVLAVFGG